MFKTVSILRSKGKQSILKRYNVPLNRKKYLQIYFKKYIFISGKCFCINKKKVMRRKTLFKFKEKCLLPFCRYSKGKRVGKVYSKLR